MKQPMRIMVAVACLVLVVAALWIVSKTGRSSNEGQRTFDQHVGSDENRSAVDEVLGNIRSQRVGDHTVADYDLPEDFLTRVADRIIRESYEEQFRIVVADPASSDRPDVRPLQEASPNDGSLRPEIRIVEWRETERVAAIRAELVEGYPPMPGYRAALSKEAERPWPFSPPSQDAPSGIRRAAEMVGKQLARDGLMWTLAQAVEAIGPQTLSAETSDAVLLETLRAVGLPVDLIEQFHLADHRGAASLVRWIVGELSAGKKAIDLRSIVIGIPFDFAASWPGFQVATESGEHEVTGLRMQLTRGGYWDGVGDGGNVDLLRQLVEAMPQVKMIAAIERRNLDEFITTASDWPLHREWPLELIPVERPVAQWAHDNGKSGMIRSHPATMVPRFASRGEIGAIFVPGETYVMEGMVAARHRVVQSPLLFQGGNLMAVQHPTTGERLLLIGEAEIHRNRVLGLTPQQVLDAFRVEFGVDQCLVLPAVSFHVDMDLCVRAHDGRLMAFVNDTPKASAIVLESAIGLMRAKGFMDEQEAKSAIEHLTAKRWRDALNIIGPRLHAQSDGFGRLTQAFAEHFSTGPTDSGVGIVHRILQSLDTLAAISMTAEDSGGSPAERVYLDALARREAARISMHHELKKLGFEVVPIPSLADGSRGMNAINGIHARDVYLMPVYGGLFSRLDEAAMAGFSGAFGTSVRIVPLKSGESQRRSGAVHCSISPIFGPFAQ